MTGPAELILLGLGIVIMVLSAAGLLVVRNHHDRLHFVAPAATLGIPLIGIAVAADIGLAPPCAKVVLIIGLAAVTSPVVSAAMGFVIRRQEHQ